ncbi:MAG: EthD domain-containing protein [Acidimicrobiia bacterium]|nr:EthD domain-containing protein [Acidimicrobiia bacterium]MBV8305830.1 EthD domain-containing protein [Acidimicrobiia bacterium]
MKIIYALWGQSLGSQLLAPSLHGALRTAGATRLHVNIDDADVAPAKLRITSFAAPVSAVVTVWVDGQPAEVSRLLTDISERCAGWEVEERTPLEPPHTGPGERTPGLAQMAFLRIPDELDEAEWRHRWQDLHTPVAIETQATFGYTQNRVLRPILGDERVDAIVEELFPMEAMTSLHAFYGSGGDDAELGRRLDRMMKSVTSFGADRNLDSVPTSRYIFDLEP